MPVCAHVRVSTNRQVRSLQVHAVFCPCRSWNHCRGRRSSRSACELPEFAGRRMCCFYRSTFLAGQPLFCSTAQSAQSPDADRHQPHWITTIAMSEAVDLSEGCYAHRTTTPHTRDPDRMRT